MRAHAMTDYITRRANVSPSPGPHPVFDTFMDAITCGDRDLQDYHQRSLGACLSGAINDHWLLFWKGTGGNGKNTLADLVVWIMGDYAKVIPTETLMQRKQEAHLTEMANMLGVRLAVSSEVAEGMYWDESRIKSLTGDATISARFMRQDHFEFRRTHKHIVLGNNRPLLRVVDEAIKRRLHVVPFNASFTGSAADPFMGDKLRKEAPQILQWLIDGHAIWKQAGRLVKCAAVEAETVDYFEAQSTNDSWVEECCATGDGRRATASELYLSYKDWKTKRGEGVISQTRFGEWMSTRFRKVKAGSIHYEGIDLIYR